MWDLWWTKLHWGRFSPSTSVYPANAAPHSSSSTSSSSSGAGTIDQLVADVPNELILTLLKSEKIKLPIINENRIEGWKNSKIQ
jgi:hypothetical protein